MSCDCGDSKCWSCGTAQGTRRIPPGHVGITDPRPIPLHGPQTCVEHGPTVTVTWRSGDRCPLCEGYEGERTVRAALSALLAAVEDALNVRADQGEAPWDRVDFHDYIKDARKALGE